VKKKYRYPLTIIVYLNRPGMATDQNKPER